MLFEKYAFNAWYEKHAFYMFYKTHVLHTILHVRKMCVNERRLNMCYSIYMFKMRFKKHMVYACCTFSCVVISVSVRPSSG